MSDEKGFSTPNIRYFAKIALPEYSHEPAKRVNRAFSIIFRLLNRTGKIPLIYPCLFLALHKIAWSPENIMNLLIKNSSKFMQSGKFTPSLLARETP
ncbi:hypothetical protein [Aliidiomarina haloalkalitolerans]|uniref:hypothetical protein n=1 Tax=Aliidiomarina haloalkalitolerans TaxID=859059 RepID=UPI000F87B39E|nr:hypothetical protein [Aliidiomarina haloalkalitolerans]